LSTRDFLNAVLAWIQTSSLTDEEYDSVSLVSAGYDQSTYAALSLVLDSRESVSSLQDRLKAFFESKGVEVTAVVSSGKSNIFLGSEL
jgi:hypothetical protein